MKNKKDEDNKRILDLSWRCLTHFLGWVRENLNPQDVFFPHQLDQWAKENEYIKKDME